MNKEISIIGFGKFGKFIAEQLIINGLDVSVTNPSNKSREAEKIGAKFVDLDTALENKTIILAMPMDSLAEVLHKIKNKLKPGTLVIDVCSLKIFACKAMKEILPKDKDIEIIGTHPLFGPQPNPEDIKGMKIALCKVRCKQELFDNVNKSLKKIGLKTFIVTPEEHDKQMAQSQALTHFIGQITKKMNIKRVDLSTKTFDELIGIIDIVKNNSPKLFKNMQQMNPFAKNMRKDFIKSAKEINEELR